jgi:hypothetical protein
MDWKTLHRELACLNWMILLVLASLSYFLLSPALTTGVILGGFIIIANFNVMQHTICRAFYRQGKGKSMKASIIGKYYLRLLALGIVIYVLITNGWADPIGLAIGLSTVVFSIVVFGITMALKAKFREAT